MMNVFDEYRAKLRTPQQAVSIVKSGDWVDYTTNVGFPALCDAALAARREELTDVKIRGNLIFGPLRTVESDPAREHFTYNSWHCSGYERRLCDRGLCSYIPMVFRNLAWYYREFLTVNVAMMSVAPMDKHGYFNLSCAAGVGRPILEKADVVILEVNESSTAASARASTSARPTLLSKGRTALCRNCPLPFQRSKTKELPLTSRNISKTAPRFSLASAACRTPSARSSQSPI